MSVRPLVRRRLARLGNVRTRNKVRFDRSIPRALLCFCGHYGGEYIRSSATGITKVERLVMVLCDARIPLCTADKRHFFLRPYISGRTKGDEDVVGIVRFENEGPESQEWHGH